MTDREKLYELIDSDDIMNIPTENFRHSLADHLISNGVAVREKGEWVGDSKEECPFCGERSKWFYDNFCPNCGADMRGEQHEP